MLLPYARSLCDARSALAMLADSASCIEASSAYEHVLITLDAIHGNDGPVTDPYGLPELRDPLLAFAVHAIEELNSHGVDELHVELLLALLDNAIVLDIR